MKITRNLSIIILCAMLGALVWRSIEVRRLKNQIELATGRYELLRSRWQALLDTPPRTVVITREVVSHAAGGAVTPQPLESLPAGDTLAVEVNRYADLYVLNDSVQAYWEATTTGSLDRFRISRVVYPQRTVTREVIVPPWPLDTTGKPGPATAHRIRNQLWLYISQAFEPSGPSSLRAGALWQIRQKWGIGVGAGYCFRQGSAQVEATLLLNLR